MYLPTTCKLFRKNNDVTTAEYITHTDGYSNSNLYLY